MTIASFVAFTWGLYLAVAAWRVRGRGRRAAATLLAGAFGLVVALGAVLHVAGVEAGRGLALLGAVTAALAFGWSLSAGMRAETADLIRRGLLFLVGLGVVALLVAGCAGPARLPVEEPARGIDEPSGIARRGDEVVIVGDDDPELVFLPASTPRAGVALVPIRPDRLRRTRLPFSGASDLEGVAELADGRLVALSEDSRALWDEHGLVARFTDDSLAETGGRGLEGLAVRARPDGSSRIAVLWEGGYLDCAGADCDSARLPRIVVHDLAPGARDVELGPETALLDVRLHPPLLPGHEPFAQRFRGADLTWIELPDGSDGFLVLLSSGAARLPPAGDAAECPLPDPGGSPRRWCHKWLLRFDENGRPVGDPLDLDTRIPADLAYENWEGLGWWERERRVVLCYDAPWRPDDPVPPILFLELPVEWAQR
ncbi:MAG: hypothetical protein KC591_12890, partial [Gemmatimonadetes bacterium]|nr:hypothetical protein [Gemmatimonadota bacterium]